MIIDFPGTKGEIEESSRLHQYHSSIIIKYKDTQILIDFGTKYNPLLIDRINDFDFILITYAHPDHYIWTKQEENRIKIPVYLTKVTLDYSKYKPLKHKIIESNKKYNLKDLDITSYDVIHSLRCPAVGYKIRGDKTIVYAPDILDFEMDKGIVFEGISALIADGSSLNINMARRREEKLFGHTRIKTVIGWCKKYGIDNLIITHCGSQAERGGNQCQRIRPHGGRDGQGQGHIAYDGYRT